MRFKNGVEYVPLLFLVCAAVVLVIVGMSPRPVFAADCSVVQHGEPSPADHAYLASDYAKAEALYRGALKASPGNTQLIEGLVYALLREGKVQEASDAIEEALTRAPGKAALITLRGEVEYREGEPWKAAGSADESIKLDPFNPRTHLLFSKLAQISCSSIEEKEPGLGVLPGRLYWRNRPLLPPASPTRGIASELRHPCKIEVT